MIFLGGEPSDGVLFTIINVIKHGETQIKKALLIIASKYRLQIHSSIKEIPLPLLICFIYIREIK